jgi:hypothetical protein
LADFILFVVQEYAKFAKGYDAILFGIEVRHVSLNIWNCMCLFMQAAPWRNNFTVKTSVAIASLTA